ncbi:NADH-quinone oxidoreductase subunit C [Rhizobium oryzicola]|uniref:NADH-quinone oxidoreductase subunit C n=1 Tax=Rhizobium oryzicola TaxID=1232668 RepID=A0ABT8SUK9_9HYPH|nr:NADH-quinone oxidoreductase subunit C [Rhizobium oryzicola]MDO1581824.1 NADH-quinone oxidoreductase subunit C [Rhizobium oryzicola]
MTEALNEFLAYVEAAKPGLIASSKVEFDELTLSVEADNVIALLTFLRDDPKSGFVNLIDVCGLDWPKRERRFDVVYHLLSPRKNMRVRVKVATAEDVAIPSACSVYPGADWFEREAWDMYGILFTGHPDLRRILTDYGFEGHPLRKDFPTTGFVEVRYDDSAKRVVYEPVQLRQEFRNFDFLSPWEGTDYVLPGDEKAKA